MKFFRSIHLNKIWLYLFLVFWFIILFSSLPMDWLFAFLIIIISFFVIRKFKISKFGIILFLISFLTRLIVVLLVETPPESDFLVLYNASKSLINGNYSFLTDSYFVMWRYQLGFVFIQSLFLKVFDSILFLKIVNCFVSSMVVVLVYLIAKEFVSEISSRLVSMIYTFLPFAFTYVTILTNQHIASLIIYFSFYIIISNKIKLKNYIKYIIFSILLAIANMVRPESIIPLFSIVLFFFFKIRKVTFKKTIKNIAILVVSYSLCTFAISLMFSVSGLAKDGLKNNNPYWKFVLGFNHETGGTYSNEDVKFINDVDKEMDVIKERIFTSPLKLLKLFYRKIRAFWSSTTLDWTFNFVNDKSIFVFNAPFLISNIVMFLENLNNRIMLIMYLFVFIGVYSLICNKEYNSKIFLIINQVFVTFCIYLLIEVQPRYAYHIQISIFILAALGIDKVIEFFENKVNYRNIK